MAKTVVDVSQIHLFVMLKQFLLNQKKENYGSIALLQNEMEQATIDAQITEVDAFIADVQTHKATLSA